MIKIDLSEFFSDHVVFGWYLDDYRVRIRGAACLKWVRRWAWADQRFSKSMPWHRCWKWDDD